MTSIMPNHLNLPRCNGTDAKLVLHYLGNVFSYSTVMMQGLYPYIKNIRTSFLPHQIDYL